ncbi:16S rRNA (guanine(527)-N(7))-methyltransferase RsmG [Nocardioides sp. Kera G14]|uniref:16S rRNA (guanine(527)-N(7))-methyltransferase RsmG n=1 Tax=Nocardioides sp. Kera G14 TaxID=2884264 RepID=UPI001D127538|nr:16S rRNA (guanine(527)-N(7))-methyltransferase RsmG [Nocardioides sp. Kera G14]UDY23580.1 16S rRNA (guanine(527)-N(7))-methyltransferase RsmG [Nocardioides sp. Kera G14]
MTEEPIAAPPAPQAAAEVVPADRLPLLEAYAGWLADAGTVRGLIGPREVPRLWDRHLLNCAVLERLMPTGATVADIGSGAGLPGLVLAIVRPDLRVTLIEPLLRRTTFLSEVAEALDLANVEVVRGRSDVLHGERTFDVVTSRAVAPLGRLLEWSMPLVSSEGALVAMKGSSVATEIDEAAETLARLGCAEPSVSVLGEGVLESTTVALRVAWADPGRVGLRSARDNTASGKTQKAEKKKAPRGGRSTKSGAAKASKNRQGRPRP